MFVYFVAKPYDCKAITQRWYDEIKLYKWNNPTFSTATGHFTQVVWKASRELGIGLATFKNKGNVTSGDFIPLGD
jgi:hypothetical protein